MVLALAALLLAACGSSTSTNVTSPSSAGRCQTTVTGNPVAFGASGGVGAITVSAARECAWTAASQAPWILLTSASEGQGDGSLSYRVVENADPVARRGAIAVGGQQVSVAEGPAACRYDISPSSSNLTAAGGQFTISVRAHAACPWTVATSAAGVQVSPVSGKGNGDIRIVVGANPGAARPIEVIVAGQRVDLVQPSVSGPSPAPAPPPAP